MFWTATLRRLRRPRRPSVMFPLLGGGGRPDGRHTLGLGSSWLLILTALRAGPERPVHLFAGRSGTGKSLRLSARKMHPLPAYWGSSF